ncbi:hypothetical protein AOLI_G00115430 [Acnodon oligacanthus]
MPVTNGKEACFHTQISAPLRNTASTKAKRITVMDDSASYHKLERERKNQFTCWWTFSNRPWFLWDPVLKQTLDALLISEQLLQNYMGFLSRRPPSEAQLEQSRLVSDEQPQANTGTRATPHRQQCW